MSENSWPKDASPELPGAGPGDRGMQVAEVVPTQRPETMKSPLGDTGSTVDVAKNEASDVAAQATDSAQRVTQAVKSEAGNVATEAKSNAKDLMAQAKSDLTDQAGVQQQKLAEGLRSVSDELHSMVSASDESGMATDLVRQAAERTSTAASWLDGRDPGSLLSEVTSFARQKPGTFLLLAAGAGVLAGRLSRSLSAGTPEIGTHGSATDTSASVGRGTDASGAIQPPSVQLPTPNMTTASTTTPEATDPAEAEDRAEFGAQDRWGSEPVVNNPLEPNDPMRDAFGGDRR